MRIPSGVTDQYIYFVAVDATDFTTRETGLTTWTVYRSRNGGAAAAYTTPTINETDATNMPGVYELLLDEDMTIDAGDDSQEVALHITHAGMAPVTRTFELYRPKITAGSTSTAQTGDSFARLGSPAGASIAADIATVDTVVDGIQTDLSNGTDGLGAIKADTAAILVDTAEIGAAGVGLTALATAAALATVDGNVDAILADTADMQPKIGTPAGASVSADIAAVKADTAATLVDTGTDIPASIAALNDLSAAEVNAEVLDVLVTDTFAEPAQGAPGATISLKDKIGFIYKFLRNKKTATSTTISVFNDDASTVDHKSTISDDGTTYTEGEYASGP